MSVRRMKLSEFREVVRAVLREFVSKDETSSEPNFSKDVNAATSKAHMDVGLDESEEDHVDTHGGKKTPDPRWEEHADPTGTEWSSGLD